MTKYITTFLIIISMALAPAVYAQDQTSVPQEEIPIDENIQEQIDDEGLNDAYVLDDAPLEELQPEAEFQSIESENNVKYVSPTSPYAAQESSKWHGAALAIVAVVIAAVVAVLVAKNDGESSSNKSSKHPCAGCRF